MTSIFSFDSETKEFTAITGSVTATEFLEECPNCYLTYFSESISKNKFLKVFEPRPTISKRDPRFTHYWYELPSHRIPPEISAFALLIQ